MRNAYKILVGKSEAKKPLRLWDPGDDGRIILELIIRHWDMKFALNASG
jgi:hypothetical protein